MVDLRCYYLEREVYMKKLNISHIFCFLLGGIILGGVAGVTAYTIAANQIMILLT